MTDLETLRLEMEAAAEAQDFERAARLRDQYDLLLAGSALRRQAPGAMGLGTSDPTPRRPEGWTPPRKPDPMTAASRPARRRGR